MNIEDEMSAFCQCLCAVPVPAMQRNCLKAKSHTYPDLAPWLSSVMWANWVACAVVRADVADSGVCHVFDNISYIQGYRQPNQLQVSDYYSTTDINPIHPIRSS